MNLRFVHSLAVSEQVYRHPPSGRGKLLVVGVVGASVLLAIAAWIYRDHIRKAKLNAAPTAATLPATLTESD